MAGWLYRNLKNTVEEIVVSTSTHKLICCDGDADDKSTPQLAALLRAACRQLSALDRL